MTIRLFGAAALFAGAALFATAAQAAGDPAQGKIKSQTCLGCHGIPGYMTVYPGYPVPKLAGQHAAYIVAALKEYKSGNRDFPTMQAQASALSEQDMQDIAAYFESLAKPVAGAAEKGASQ
ncbi:MAG TPA: cytochrome c [Gammaproteobacteria bacterium]|jgi:cytochrome c553|nr:cytochrome c [Gammaproteobacteria bacterium]HET7587503.1 cytochrome c [Gammaproteobacteria bacterium]